MRHFTVLAALLLGLSGPQIASASSSGSWRMQRAADPRVPLASSLYDVACPTSRLCLAVGYRTDAGGSQVPLAERWDGSGWATQVTPSPSGSTSSFLSAVSCSAPKGCTAVGSYESAANASESLVERWNGRRWTLQSVREPSNSLGSSLSGVACVTGRACIAVGGYETASGHDFTLAERWDGRVWAEQHTPSPSGSGFARLDSVACSGKRADACTAVGEYDLSSGSDRALAERWNGKSWRLQSAPDPPGAKAVQLFSVACPAVRTCRAVGYYVTPAGLTLMLAEGWNGRRWALERTVQPPRTQAVDVEKIFCLDVAHCTAVGFDKNDEGTPVTVVEVWAGSRWEPRPSPNPTGSVGSGLFGVSCRDVRTCLAVGAASFSGIGVTLAERWNGRRWALQHVPSPSKGTGALLDAVACPRSTTCVAAGSYAGASGHTVSLAEAWNGRTWEVEATENPSGATFTSLEGVTCPKPSSCIAVGQYENAAGQYETLAEGWNGTRWRIEATPNPSGAVVSDLGSVSCSSVTSCTAVGDFSSGTGPHFPLAERWNGKEWRLETPALPAGSTTSGFIGVSCPGEDACTAVGFYRNGVDVEESLAEEWNGATWEVDTTPAPAGAEGSQLSAVSCARATSCVAVGHYEDASGVDESLVEVGNGSLWKLQASANPSGATGTDLFGVACPRRTLCTAVGSEETARHDIDIVAERWNGSRWALQKTPMPRGASQSFLIGVKCPSAEVCTAVGSSRKGSATLPLAERYEATR